MRATSRAVIRGAANEERSMAETEKKQDVGTKGDLFHFHGGRSGFRNSLAICRRFVVATTTETICAAPIAAGISRSPDEVKQREKGEKGPGWELGGAPDDQLEVGKIEETKGQMPRDG